LGNAKYFWAPPEKKPMSVFVAILFEEDSQSPPAAAAAAADYKPSRLVPSLFIKIKRHTHSEIGVGIHADRQKECTSTNESIHNKNNIAFLYLL
jgi:hypothetical protein